MIRPIQKFGGPPLHDCAAEVGELTKDIQTLIDDMIETIYAAPGIGLDPPRKLAWPSEFSSSIPRSATRPKDLLVFINPEFVEQEGVQLEEEGCLSVPEFNATVARPMRAVIRGMDWTGPGYATSKAGSCWRARFSMRWTISTASCFSIVCAASNATSS